MGSGGNSVFLRKLQTVSRAAALCYVPESNTAPVPHVPTHTRPGFLLHGWPVSYGRLVCVPRELGNARPRAQRPRCVCFGERSGLSAVAGLVLCVRLRHAAVWAGSGPLSAEASQDGGKGVGHLVHWRCWASWAWGDGRDSDVAVVVTSGLAEIAGGGESDK